MARPYKCPHCGTVGQSTAKGFRYNKAGKVRLRRCRSCGRRWTVGPAAVEHENSKAPAEEGTPELPADSSTNETGVPSQESAANTEDFVDADSLLARNDE